MESGRRVAAVLRLRRHHVSLIIALLLTGTAATAAHAAGLGSSPGFGGRLMLTASQWASDQASPTMDAMFPPGGFAMQHPILVWWVALEAMGLLAFPITFVFLGNLSDRGFVIAKTVGLLLVSYLVWITASLGVAHNDRTTVFAAICLLLLASVALFVRLRREIVAFVRLRWRLVLSAEAVFLAGFVLFLLLRMWYPDLGHQYSPVSATSTGAGRMGEKQMEMAFLNSVVRSQVFPPYDPFYAHGYINYYYYGFVLVGTLCKLTQIAPATGFNLAIATFFALLVGGIFSCVLSLTGRVVPSLIGAALVGVVANLNGGWQLLRGLMDVSQVHSSFPVGGGLIGILAGLEQVVFAHASLPPFDFWESTRIVPPEGIAISEFPYFTYLFGDLHPHLIAFPLTAAALALAVSLFLGSEGRMWRLAITALMGGLVMGSIAATNPWDFPTYLVVVALGALVGTFATRRELSLRLLVRPALWLAGLAALSYVLFLPFDRSYQTVFNSGIGLTRDITPTALSGLCQGNPAPCSQIVHNALVTPLSIYLEQFGLFLFILLSFLLLLLGIDAGAAARSRRWVTRGQFALYYRDRMPSLRRAGRAVRRMRGPVEPVADPALVTGVVILMAGLILLRYYLLAFLIFCIGLTVALILRLARRLPAQQLFVLALLLVPLLLSVLTQVFYVKDFLAGGPAFRMNTVFKFYNQSWVLFSVTAAAALYFLVVRLAPGAAQPEPVNVAEPLFAGVAVGAVETGGTDPATRDDPHYPPLDSPPSDPGPLSGWQRLTRVADRHVLWSTAFCLLVAGCLIYTYAGTVARETYRQAWLPEGSVPFTLDGMAFMKVAYPGDYAGISWLNGHARGAPVIAEAYDPNGGYNWYSRVADFTGLPDIMNGIHEQEQRFGQDFPRRTADVANLYSSPSVSTAWQVIHRYGVRYIYVGWSETHCTSDVCYSKPGLAKFKRMVGHGLVVAYRGPGTTIYRVTQS
jgi:YYY domain-containing protein